MSAARTLRISLAGTALFALLALARPSPGGDFHSGESLACSDCHTMHNSLGGQPMRYDASGAPAQKLLRHATALTLCVYCHDGSNPNAPDVVAPVSYLPDTAGGFFPRVYDQPSGTAHVLGAAPVVPPGGTQSMTLTCVTCHEPHGGPGWRNLKVDPLKTGATNLVVADELVKPDGFNAVQVYAPSNVTYKSGFSTWCGTCHGDFHGRSAAQEGTSSPWLRHPQDQTLATARNVDLPYWNTALANRIPVESPNDNLVPSNDDRVFCLSCHKAHGSANRAATIFADGASLTSTCQQCHNE
jgi:predicted CXXCH cytochrome family protein